MTSLVLRDGRDSDAQGLIELIGRVFEEYENCILDVDGEMPELLAISSAFERDSGRFWVAERAGRVVGCAGIAPAKDTRGVELKKLYVAASERGSGLGGRLLALVEAEARARDAAFVDLWSDTRFLTAHGFYARRGFERGPETRELHDKSDTVEYYFRKSL